MFVLFDSGLELTLLENGNFCVVPRTSEMKEEAKETIEKLLNKEVGFILFYAIGYVLRWTYTSVPSGQLTLKMSKCVFKIQHEYIGAERQKRISKPFVPFVQCGAFD